MTAKVLLVDDEDTLLQSLRRSFRSRYDLILAEGGMSGIEAIKGDTSIAVIVSDMQMPDINGLKVLSEAKKVAPNTVRVMLTGNIDQQTAVDAVNQAGVFRFVNKPCEPEALANVIDQAIKHHEHLIAEKIILSRTLTATVGLTTELLALANPKAHGRSVRLRDMAKKLAAKLQFDDHWQLEIAAMLSQIGCLSNHTGEQQLPTPFSLEWESMLKQQSDASAHLVGRVPKLERVAGIIQFQHSNVPPAYLQESDHRLSKFLRMLIDFDYIHERESAAQAIQLMQRHPSHYDSVALETFKKIVVGDFVVQRIQVSDLAIGMILEEHVLTSSGDIIISKGHEITDLLIERLRNFQRNGLGVTEPIVVRCLPQLAAA